MQSETTNTRLEASERRFHGAPFDEKSFFLIVGKSLGLYITRRWELYEKNFQPLLAMTSLSGLLHVANNKFIMTYLHKNNLCAHIGREIALVHMNMNFYRRGMNLKGAKIFPDRKYSPSFNRTLIIHTFFGCSLSRKIAVKGWTKGFMTSQMKALRFSFPFSTFPNVCQH